MVSSASSMRLDPDGTARLLVGGTLATVAVMAVLVHHPGVGLGIAAILAMIALAAGAHHHASLTIMWPLTVVALVQPWNGLRILPFVAVGDIALTVLVVLAIMLFARARAVEPVIVTLIGMLLVTAGGTLGMAAAGGASGGGEMAKFVLGAPVVVLVVMVIGPTYRECLLLLTAYSIGAGVNAVVAASEPVDPAFGRSDGWSAHAGHLALGGMLGFFVLLGWTLNARHPALRCLAGIGSLICVYGVILSGTRSAVLGVVAGLVFLAITARLRGIIYLGTAGIAAITFLKLIVPFLPYRNNIERAFGTGELAGGTELTNSLHADALHEALALIGQHPWTGVGFAQGQVAHNLVLQVASLGGLLAILGLIVAWTPMAFFAAKHLSQGWTPEQGMRICTLAGVIAYLVLAQFQPLIWDRHLWFVVTLTMLVQVTSMKSDRTSSLEDGPRGEPHEPVVRSA